MTPEVRAQLTNPNLREILDRKPAAAFPVNIVTAHVQAANYVPTAYGRPGAQGSSYSVITNREVEKEDDMKQIAELPGIRGIATVIPVVVA